MDLEPKFLPVSPQHISPLIPPPVPDNMNFQATVDDLIVLLLNNKKKNINQNHRLHKNHCRNRYIQIRNLLHQ